MDNPKRYGLSACWWTTKYVWSDLQKRGFVRVAKERFWEAVGGALVTAILYAIQFPPLTWSTQGKIAFYAVAFVVVALVLSYLRFLHVAPAKINDEKQQEIAELKAQIGLLENREPQTDMPLPAILSFFSDELGYETISEIECDLADAVVNERVHLRGLGPVSPSSLPIAGSILATHIFIFSENRLQELVVALQDDSGTVFRIGADSIVKGGVVWDLEAGKISYAVPVFWEEEIRSRKWPNAKRDPNSPTPRT